MVFFLSFAAEEVLHQLRGFVGKQALGDFRLGVEHAGGVAAVAALRVFRPVDEAPHLCPGYGSGTHGAGFYGHVERALVQILGPEVVFGSGDGLHLSVGRGVAQRLGQVVCTGDDAFLADDDGSDGHFVFRIGPAGFFECLAHVFFVGHGGKRG